MEWNGDKPSRILSYILGVYLAYIVLNDKKSMWKLAALLHLAIVQPCIAKRSFFVR
jgi:hypothetical protein